MLSSTSLITGNTKSTQHGLPPPPQPVSLASPSFPGNGRFAFTTTQTASVGFQVTRLRGPLIFSDPLVSVRDGPDSPLSMVNPTPAPVPKTWEARVVLPDPSPSPSVSRSRGLGSGPSEPGPVSPAPDAAAASKDTAVLFISLLFFGLGFCFFLTVFGETTSPAFRPVQFSQPEMLTPHPPATHTQLLDQQLPFDFGVEALGMLCWSPLPKALPEARLCARPRTDRCEGQGPGRLVGVNPDPVQGARQGLRLPCCTGPGGEATRMARRLH